MQIIPTNTTNSAYGFYNSTGESAGASFFDAMTDALEAVQDGDYASATSALQGENNGTLVESPYTRHTTDGVTYELSEVCFTKNELHELRQQLLKEGAPEESLRQFDILADQPDGATLAQVLASLMGKSSSVNLSEDDVHSITALLGQIDPSGQLATDAIDMMQRGNGQAALELIEGALGKMGLDMSIDIDRNAILALGRGLGLNQDSLRGLMSNFGGHSSLTVNAEQFGAFMNPAKNQFMHDAANMAKLDDALEKTLKPMIAKARDRMEKEKAASALQDRRVEQSRILIDRTVQKNSREILDNTVAGETPDATVSRENLAQAVNLENNIKDAASNRAHVNNAQFTVNGEMPQGQVKPMSGDFQQGQNGSSFLNQNSKDESSGWQTLLGQINVKSEKSASSANSMNQDSVVYSMLQGNMEQQPMPSEMNLQKAQLSTQVASQVEQGMLTAMRNGATRLDLQLHPAELGAIAITLIARNGELTAKITSEKSETAEMMTRQLDTIRVNLEQQGIKVDKIEVQLENKQDNYANNFENMDQHNSRQEENAFREGIKRLRTLANMRNINENTENSVLAQSMHNKIETARYAGRALHVVA